MQDYEYLWLAAQNGLEAQARAAADACVPAAFSEAKGDVSWSVKGSDWDNQRLVLARLLEQKLAKPVEKRPAKAIESAPEPAAPVGPSEKEIAAAKEAEAGLRKAIIEGVQKGKQASVYVEVFGATARVKLVRADEQNLVARMAGTDVDIPWSTLSPRCFFGIAKQYSDDKDALAVYRRGMNIGEESDGGNTAE